MAQRKGAGVLLTTLGQRATPTAIPLAPAARVDLRACRGRPRRARAGDRAHGRESGSGKPTAVRAFVGSPDPTRCTVLYSAEPLIGITGFYREVLMQLGDAVPDVLALDGVGHPPCLRPGDE
jgi:hypothetical protein